MRAMDNTQKMQKLVADLTAMFEAIEQVGTIKYLFDLTKEMDPFHRGRLFSALKTHLDYAETHLRRAVQHTEFELKDRAQAKAGEEDGA